MTHAKINAQYFIKRSLAAITKSALVLTCIASTPLLAVDEEKATEEISSNTSVQTEDSPQEKQSTSNSIPKEQSTKKAPPASRFKPSEEISEDYSVPFPVDI